MAGGLAHFPGLSQPVTIDSAALPAEEAGELERLVTATRWFDRPTGGGTAPPGAADYRRYEVTIEAEGQRSTRHLADPVDDPALQALLDYLQAKAQALRAAARARAADQRPAAPAE
jgi:hypothetical protein